MRIILLGIRVNINTLSANTLQCTLNEPGCLTLVIDTQRKHSNLTHLVYQTKHAPYCEGYTTSGYGTKLMSVVDQLNNIYMIKTCALEDMSKVGQDYLSMLYFIKHGMTWYGHLNYMRPDEEKFRRRAKYFLSMPMSFWCGSLYDNNEDVALDAEVMAIKYRNYSFVDLVKNVTDKEDREILNDLWCETMLRGSNLTSEALVKSTKTYTY
jgi:hypothetical protein